MRRPLIAFALPAANLALVVAACGGATTAPAVVDLGPAPVATETATAAAWAEPAPREAAEFGMIGLLNAGAGADPNAPTAPWGRDDSLGEDPLTARGNLWGGDGGAAFGVGGLGLRGIGVDADAGVGLGTIGTVHGGGAGALGGAPRAKPAQVRMGATQVSGRLPPEVIQRIVRQSFGRFRLCYENGLRSRPDLEGKVAVKFVIARDGSVSSVSDGGSDLPDAAMIACITRAFQGLSFPEPEDHGRVTVVYPITFSPGDPKPAAKP